MHTQVRFVSSNPRKVAEARTILEARGVEVIEARLKIEELQTTDAGALIRDKVLKAFQRIGRPLFVEHTGLYIAAAGGLPGGLTQIFWDSLEVDRFTKIFGALPSPRLAAVKSSIAYCDGRRIFTFEGETAGQLADAPRGAPKFQWDCVFQPDASTRTFAELGDEKHEFSMRRVALDRLADHLATVRR